MLTLLGSHRTVPIDFMKLAMSLNFASPLPSESISMNASFTNLVWSSVSLHAESAGTSSFFIIAPIVSVTTMLWRATMALGRKRS